MAFVSPTHKDPAGIGAVGAQSGDIRSLRVTLLCGAGDGEINAILDHALRLSEALRDMGALVDVHVCAARAGRKLHPSKHLGVEIRLDPRASDLVLLEYNPFLYGRWGFAPGVVARLWRLRLRRRRPRLALFIHEPYVPMVTWRWTLMGVWQRIQLLALRAASDVVFVSVQVWAERFRASWPTRPTVHVPVGSNLPDMREERETERRRLGVDEDTLVVAKLGTAHPGQSLEPVASALEALARSGRRVVLLALGSGARVPERVPHLVEVHAPGLLAASDLARSLAAADLFFAPFIDGVSTRRTSLMAALQHGLPVIGTEGVLTDDVFRRSRQALRLVPVGEPDLFADVAVDLADRPEERINLGCAARSLYDDEFNWTITAHRVLDAVRGTT